MKKGTKKGTITRQSTLKTLNELRKLSGKQKAGIWADLAERIAKPRRNRKGINLFRLEKLFDGKIMIVPDKVLGAGKVSKPIEVACLSISEKARQGIIDAKGKVYSLNELIQKNPEGKNLVIVK